MTSRRLAVLAGIGLATAAWATPASMPTRLEVVAGARIVWSAPILAGEPFDIAFYHSQERVRWIQHYAMGNGDDIVQRGSTFPSYGAGMPLGSVIRTPAGFRAAAERRFDVIRMLNSRHAALTLHHRRTTLPIGQWLDEFEPFVIRVR